MDARIVDLEKLRQPLSDEAPAGVNLKGSNDGALAEIEELFKEARRMDRKAEQNSDSDGDALAASRKLAPKCVYVLETKSRDLRVASYLIEAWARTEGFRGLATGFDVARAMVESGHWERLYPEPDPDHGPVDDKRRAETRVESLKQLVAEPENGPLFKAIRLISLFESGVGQGLGLGHRQLASFSERITTAVGETSPEAFRSTLSGIRDASEKWASLVEAIGTASDWTVAVPKDPLNDILAQCEQAIMEWAPGLQGETLARGADAAGHAHGVTTDAGLPQPAVAARSSSAVTSRDDVLRQLEQAARFFELRDPHSLIAAQIKNVVRMARLPLVDYYRELIKDTDGFARMAGLDSSVSDAG